MASLLWIVLVAIIAIGLRILSQNVLLKGLVTIFINKLTERILPPQPVHWLQNYNPREEIWQRLEIQEDFQERPNIVFILADDLGHNDISGGCGIDTPNIDSIARNGLNFTHAHASQATCAPSRAALYTGRYPTSIGMEFTPIPKFFAKFMADKRPPEEVQPIYHDELYHSVPDMKDISMPSNIPTIAEALREYGYHNYFFGKWDGTFRVDNNTPLHRGYDETLGFLLGSSLYASPHDTRIVAANNISVDNFMKKMLSYKISHNDGPLFEPAEYMTDYLGKEASHLIKKLGERQKKTVSSSAADQRRDEPWFMTVAFTAPHNPFQALKSDFEREDIQKIPSFIGKIYASMILALDRNVGRILDALKESGQYENTIVIFTSDNGAAPYVGLPHLNAPYRGWKGTLFEGGIRIPFLMQWPRQLPAATEVAEPIIHIDLFPTLLAVATKGIRWGSQRVSSFLSGLKLDGKNILSGWQRQWEKKDVVEGGVGADQGSEVRTFFWRSGSYRAIKYDHFKLQVHSHLDKLWFYDLSTDPTERTNLVDLIANQSAFSVRKESQLVALLKQNTRFSEKIALHSPLDPRDPEALLKTLVFVYLELEEWNARQHAPLWPALVELPICIDKPQRSDIVCRLDDEYVIWAN